MKWVPVDKTKKTADALYLQLVGEKGAQKPITYAGTDTPAQFTYTQTIERTNRKDTSQPPAPKAEPVKGDK